VNDLKTGLNTIRRRIHSPKPKTFKEPHLDHLEKRGNMKASQQNHPRRAHLWGSIIVGVVVVLGCSQDALAQWTTPNTSGNINSTNTGNVGVGTPTPVYKFDVSGGTNAFRAKASTANSGDTIATFENNAGIVGIIRANGFFGIGTVNPTTALEIGRNGAGSPTGLTITGGSAIAAPILYFNYADAGLNLKRWMLFGDINGGFSLATQPDAGGSASQKVFVSNAGNVGIGTTTPGQKLVVNGGANTALQIGDRGMSGSVGLQFLGSGYKHAAMRFDGDNLVVENASNTSLPSTWYNSQPMNLVIRNGNLNVAAGGLCIAGDCKTSWSQVVGSGSSPWITSPAPSTNISYNTGNVGIGTSSPSAKLHISAGDSSFALFGPNTTWGGTLAVGSGAALVSPISGRAQVLSSNGNLHLDAGTNQNVYVGWLTASNTIINGQGGNVGIGTQTPTAKLDVKGNVSVTGDITATGNIAAKYQDVAEWVPSAQKLSAGTVVVLDPSRTNHVLASIKSYDLGVAGVVTDHPGIILGESGDNKLKIATTGRVRLKVDASHGPIAIGDLLVTSDIPGVAMKSEPISIGGRLMHTPGTLIGKALEPLAKGTGEILVLLSLQ